LLPRHLTTLNGVTIDFSKVQNMKTESIK